MEAPAASSGISVGLNKGHVVTRRAKVARPAHRKGVRRPALVEDVVQLTKTDCILCVTFSQNRLQSLELPDAAVARCKSCPANAAEKLVCCSQVKL